MTSAAGKNPQHEAAQAERKINFAGEQMVMQIFCDNAKTYVQLGGAALAFDAIIFSSNSYIPKTGNLADPCNFTMWICFLAAVVVGAFYQYQAVKYLEG